MDYRRLGLLVQQQQIISCVLKLESLETLNFGLAALISQSERLLGVFLVS